MKINRHIIGITLTLAGLCLFASCRERLAEPLPEEGVEMSLVAGSPGTRTVNDGFHTLWADDDVITALYAPAGDDSFRSSAFHYQGDNQFRGRVHQLSASNDWFLVYPHRSANLSAEAVHITVPRSQTQSGADSTGHLAGPGFPLVGCVRAVAQAETPHVTMHNALTCLRIPVTNTTDAPIVIRQIELTAPVSLSGEFEGDLTVEQVHWSPAQGASSDVSLTVEDGAQIPASGCAPFYIGAAPFTIPAGGRIAVKVTAVHPSAPDTEICFYQRLSFPEGRTFKPGAIASVPLSFDETHQEDLDPKRTYRYQESLSEGTYLILGNESNTNPALYICTFPAVNGECPQIRYSDDRTVTTIVTEDELITGNEVILTQSGSGWLIKAKANGRYMYYADGGVAFTSDPTLAVHTANNDSGSDLQIGNYHFYHSGSGGVFKYKTGPGNNLAFFKLGENVPEYPDGTYSVENDEVALYLNRVDAHPYNPSDRSVSYVGDYYSSSGENNRLDWPKPVPVTWTNPSSGNASKTVSVYNDASYTDLVTTVSVSASAVMAEVYNLIPGRTYYYVVKNGGSVFKEGYFETAGRRRMIKVGDSPFGKQYANNCRDLGGQVTASGTQRIRFGRIFRGSNMDGTTSTQKSYLKNDLKIGLDVDLRENNFYGNPLGIDMSTQNYDSMADLMNTGRMSVTVSDIFNAVAAGKNVYIHCSVGADRTGFVCLVLEALLGIPEERCDVDYELTSFARALHNDLAFCLRTRIPQPDVEGGSRYYYVSGDAANPKGIEYIKSFSGSTFQEKAVNYVVSGLGISSARVTAFQNAMLESN